MTRASADEQATGSSATSSDEVTAGTVERHYLLVFAANTSYMFPLPDRGEIEIGRHAAVALRIDEAAISRRHARLVIADEVTLVDLGSQNGTRVNGERIAGPRVLATADMIALGGATLVYHADRTRLEMSTGIVEFPQFRRRLEEETERVVRFQRSFGMICVVFGEGMVRETIEERLRQHLRRLDILTWAGDELLVLLPETSARETPTAAHRLGDALRGGSIELRIGHVACPDHGCDADALVASARGAAASAAPDGIVAAARNVKTLDIGDKQIVVADAAMVRLYAMIERLATADLPVLFTGETGTGKEIAATAMHVRSRRRSSQLVTLNCAALQETLVESELFGYERGAFSGAVVAKQGLLEVASGGTIFLDEIGELSPSTQAKLLRALETKRITRLGDLRERDVDFRLVAATNRDLLEEVDAGRFRRDLYFRLTGAVLAIPPLRQRVIELPLLAQAFLDEACDKAGRSAMTISPTAIAMLRAHQWPGNLRELKNLMAYVAVAFSDTVVEPAHIADRLTTRRITSAIEGTQGDAVAGSPSFRRLADEVAELEHRRIAEALAAAGGNHARAARLIGVPLRTFFAKVKKHKLSSD